MIVPSGESLRLRAVARRYTERLARRGVPAVALLGSAARGDATAGSDLDLWGLGDRDRTIQDLFDGVAVTVMVESPARVAEPLHLANVETEHALVLRDPDRTFARLLRRCARDRRKLERALTDSIAIDFYRLVRSARLAPPVSAVWALREATQCALRLALFQRCGLRSPKFRHFVATLGRPALSLVRELLSLHRSPRQLRDLGRRAEALPALLDRTFGVRGTPPPLGALAKLRGGAPEEALIKLRKYFDDVAVDPLIARHGAGDPAGLVQAHLPAEAVAFWRRVHGFGRANAADASRTARAVARLVDRLELAPSLGPEAFLRA